MTGPKPRGFTLIELLVVIAIIALLVSILMPSLAGARRMAKSSVCLANLKRVGTGLTLYMNNHRDRFPPFRLKKASARADAEDYVNKFRRKKPRWQWFVDSMEVGPIIDPTPFHAEIVSSGGYGDGSVGINGESGREMTSEYFLCPSLDHEFERDVRNGAYGFNYQYLGNARQDTNSNQWDNFPVTTSEIRAAGSTVLIADSRGAGMKHGKHSYTLDPPRLAVERRAQKFGPGESDVPGALGPGLYQYSPVEMRHGKRGNILFVDGHAEAQTHTDLGYELDEQGVPIPITDPENGSFEASNKLWSGSGRDPLAEQHRR
ncbi:MAG: prepilin-type N-terminal cleavage/methylation domain-containing protein [Planctomycetota bacterium]|jgi:prepilin-type N-terminal cleavage/methylation domain-containing protein/prepilin-type processing-associated H-X9-DG protein